jgi:phytoene dehydrogenase-like protein
VHLGGSREEIVAAADAVSRGRVAPQPFVLATQPRVLDQTRAPVGSQVLWAYTHVPCNSDVDMTEPIIRQIERFAPGFRERILGTATMSASQLTEHDPNYVGGDILGGELTLRQLIKRPVVGRTPGRRRFPGGTCALRLPHRDRPCTACTVSTRPCSPCEPSSGCARCPR